jgi:hypothetical protein
MTRPMFVVAMCVLHAACGGGSSPTTPSGSGGTGATGVADDASLFRLVTQTQPFTQYTPLPLADEFTTGRLNGSEAHTPVVRVLLNATAAGALQAGRFPLGGSFPDGAIVFKEVRPSAAAAPTLYVVMVKDRTHGLAGSGWLWAEYTPSGATAFSVTRRGNGCISCHQREAGPQRDLVRSFERQR